MTFQQDLEQIEDAARHAQREILKAIGSAHNHTITESGREAQGLPAVAARLVEKHLGTAQRFAAAAVRDAVKAREQGEATERRRRGATS